MALEQFRPLREISLAVFPPADDPNWVALVSDPAIIPTLDFDFATAFTLRGLAFYADLVLANGTRVLPVDVTYTAQLIEIGNPTQFLTPTDPALPRVPLARASLAAIPANAIRDFAGTGAGIYGLRITSVAAPLGNPGAARMRFFMRPT